MINRIKVRVKKLLRSSSLASTVEPPGTSPAVQTSGNTPVITTASPQPTAEPLETVHSPRESRSRPALGGLNTAVARTSDEALPTTASQRTPLPLSLPISGAASTTQPSKVQGVYDVGWTGLNRLSGVLRKSAISAFGPLVSAVDSISGSVEIFERASENREEYRALRAQLDSLFHDLAEHFGGATPSNMTSCIVNLAKGIDREVMLVRQKGNRSPYESYIHVEKDADEVLHYYRRIQGMLERLVLNANINIWKIVDEQATRNRLDKLSPSQASWYNSAESTSVRRDGCTANTRIEVLERLGAWAGDSDGEKVYWLNGMAGTGKTTIAYSLCEQLDGSNRLAACFFCSRQLPSCRNVNLILPTIAYQLACFSRPFRHALSGVLERNVDVHTRKLSVQFEKLIADPLLEVAESIPPGLVVVVDALDECDNDDGVGEVLDILLSHASKLSLRFFVTSRPDPEIRDRMLARKGERERFELHLHELERSIVQEDIKVYLQVKLKETQLPTTDVDCLAELSGVLFIYAATVARYITADNCLRSAKRLRTVLGASGSSPSNVNKQIDTLYTAILTAAFSDESLDDEDRNDMRLVLHTVICAQEPLTVDVMTNMLGLGQSNAVRAALRPLLSVINLRSTNELITTLHQSFPDYVLDQHRSGSFHCDTTAHNAWLTQRCFELMKVSEPPFNICNLESSYVFDINVPDLDKKVKRAIPDELVYACRYWGSHLLLSRVSSNLVDELDSWASVRLLLWMEVMNLAQCLPSGVGLLSRVQTWSKRAECTRETRELIKDAYAFTITFASSPMSGSTPHIYVSALAFWPEQRPVSRIYKRKLQGFAKLARAENSEGKSGSLATCWSGKNVTCVAIAPDGTRIAAGSADSTVCIWDAHTTRMIGQPLKGHTGAVCSVAFSPDSARVVSGSDDSTICIWDASTTRIIGAPLKGSVGPVRSVAYSSDGTRIFSATDGSTICVWDADSGVMIGQPMWSNSRIICSLSCSRDGSWIATGCDRTIRIWSVGKRTTLSRVLEGHTDSVRSVAYSLDCAHLVSGSDDTTIRIWDAHNGRVVGNPLRGHTGSVLSVGYSPDGSHVVSASYDRSIRIWNVYTEQIVGEPLRGHTWGVESVAYTPDGERIISGSGDMTIRIWDTFSGQSLRVSDLHSTTPTNLGVPLQASASQLPTPSLHRTAPKDYTRWANSIGYSPINAHIVSGISDETIYIWDAHTGQMIGKPLEGHTDRVNSVAYSPDGLYIASGSNDYTVRIWDACTGQMVGKPLEGHALWVNSVAYSPDGKYVASCSADTTIRIWGASSGRVIQRLVGHYRAVYSIVFSPDGVRMASGSVDHSVLIWDVRSGQIIGEPLQGHSRSVHSVVYSPGGARIVSGSEDGTVRIWDAYTGQMIGNPINGDHGHIHSIAFAPDGARLAIGYANATVEIWKMHNDRRVSYEALAGHTRHVRSVAWSPDGKRLASGADDYTIRIWDVQPKEPARDPSSTKSPKKKTRYRRSRVVKPDDHIGERRSDIQWALDRNGWAVSGASDLLVWVPREAQEVLQPSRVIAVIPQHGPASLDLSSALVGEQWGYCYKPA